MARTDPVSPSRRRSGHSLLFPFSSFSPKGDLMNLQTRTKTTDTFKVQIVPRSLDAEVNMAVDRALWYNHRRMTIDVVSDPAGDHQAGWWNDDNANASTSAAVQAFEVNGHRESGDRLKNPYVD